MKIKMCALVVLSLLGLATTASNASAWCFFPHCCHRNCSVIVCRPYNAFTPMCYGNMVCDGCCPSPYCGGGCCQPPIQRCLPAIYNNGCCDLGCLPAESAYAAATPAPAAGPNLPKQTPPPAQGGPNFTPPPPTPSPVYNQTSMRWNPQTMYGVQQAAYNPGYYPAYPTNYYPTNAYPTSPYPAYNYPMVPAMPVPYYWYNGR